MNALINADLEFYEVLNAFPVLKDRLKELKFNVSDLREGQTIEEYLKNKSYSNDEIAFMVRKLNSEIKNFLKEDNVYYHRVSEVSATCTYDEADEEEE